MGIVAVPVFILVFGVMVTLTGGLLLLLISTRFASNKRSSLRGKSESPTGNVSLLFFAACLAIGATWCYFVEGSALENMHVLLPMCGGCLLVLLATAGIICGVLGFLQEERRRTTAAIGLALNILGMLFSGWLVLGFILMWGKVN